MSPGPGSCPATLVEALEQLPKVELHCHVEGAIRPATVVDLARKNGIELPAEDPTELDDYDSLNGFLAVFFLVQGVLADRGDWARIAYEAAIDGVAHGLVYRESFFSPARLLVTLNTDDPTLTDLDLGYEYVSVAEAFDYGWDDMVDNALDGVGACWLEPDDKAEVATLVSDAREELRPASP